MATELELQPTDSSISLTRAIDGKWEKVCFIGPYTHNQQASEIVGFALDVESRSDIEWSDSIVLLVALDADDGARLFEVDRGTVDFVHQAGKCYPKMLSTFRIADHGHPYAWRE